MSEVSRTQESEPTRVSEPSCGREPCCSSVKLLMRPSEELIVKAHARLLSEWEKGDWHWGPTTDENIHTPVDHATAAVLGVPVHRVGDALVKAGKRPPAWWAG